MINKTTELHINKICRSCMCQTENMRNVYESKGILGGETVQIAEMLMNCTAIIIRSDDGLPDLLCQTCEDKLGSAYEFKQQCQKSDSTLRELTHRSDSIKEESLDIEVQPDLIDIPELYDDSDSDNENKKNHSTYPCPFCEKVLHTKKGLRLHERRHTGEKLRNCLVCNAQFTRTNHLIRHMKTHAKTNSSHTCNECGSNFRRLSKLIEHKKKQHKSNLEEEEKNDKINSSDDDNIEYEGYLKEEQKAKKEKECYPCKYCAKVMTTFVGLNIHMRRHTGDDLSQCQICKKSFTKMSHLKRHLQTHGVKEVEKPKSQIKKVMECEFCDRKFKYKKSFNHHMQTEHGMSDESDVPLSTYVLKQNPIHKIETSPEETASSERNDETEIQTCADVEPVNNMEKDEFAEESLSIANGDEKISDKLHVCHVCEAVFNRANHLTRHMTLHRALLIHKCERCEKAYATPEFLAKHMEEDHVNKPYICTICNKPFSRGEHLIRHLKIHQTMNAEKDKNLTCSVCEKTFNRSDYLARHIKIHLLQDKRHVCSECGKAFNRLDNLKTHQRIHTGVKEATKLHLCIYCGKEFNNSSNMIVHMRRHTGERPYKCSQCGKGFPRSHDLKCHERTHSGEKPYHCSLCGKSFNKSNKLLRHTRVHTGERPYVCNICGRAFTQSNDLALHMRRHTGARPYACGVCPARFIQSGQLKAHRRSSGHWMETQPDLKGGHRVEPVTPAGELAPIRFKTHGKLSNNDNKKLNQQTINTDLSISSDTKPLQTSLLTQHTLDLMDHPIATTINIQGQPIILDNAKLIELQNAGLVSLVSGGNGGVNVNELKFKPDTYSITTKNETMPSIKCETNNSTKNCRPQSISPNTSNNTTQFHNNSDVSYAVIQQQQQLSQSSSPHSSTATFTITENYNYQNYG